MDQLLQFIRDSTSLRKVSGAGNIGMDAFDDGAIISRINFNDADLVVSTDAHTVDPIFFPGGDIGKLSACGTLNDVLMMGAQPIAITSALILEEGFAFKDLEIILQSLDTVCSKNNVSIIAGDTKVVPKGMIDKIVMVTTGIGRRITQHSILDSGTQIGDKIIITGPIGSHGIALLSFRKGLEFDVDLQSDVASLVDFLLPLITKYSIHTMKDPTRGGIASALNEIAAKSQVEIVCTMANIPLEPAVESVSELLGLDPLEIASEGQAIITVPAEQADALLAELQHHPQGRNAAVIGEAKGENPGNVFLITKIGGKRRLQKPVGELIPRVC